MNVNNDQVVADRRRFIQRIVGSAAFAVPSVRTFMMASALGTGVAEAAGFGPAPTTTKATSTASTTRVTTTAASTTASTTQATTTAAPTTTASTTQATTTAAPTTTAPTTTVATTTLATTTNPGTTAPFLSTTPEPRGPGGGGSSSSVPEIDAMSIGAALTLLASSVLVVRDHTRPKEEPAVSSATDSSDQS